RLPRHPLTTGCATGRRLGWGTLHSRASTRRARTSGRPRPLFVRVVGSGRKRLLGLLNDRAERGTLVHRQIGHDLPVELDPGELGAVDELRIGHAFGANRGVDPLHPQRAEAALIHLAVAVGVLPGLLDRLAGDADGVLAA